MGGHGEWGGTPKIPTPEFLDIIGMGILDQHISHRPAHQS